jgi:hypothetical protein
LGKKPKSPVSPSWPAATMIFLVNYFKPNNSFLGHNLRKRLIVLFFLVGIIESYIDCFSEIG